MHTYTNPFLETRDGDPNPWNIPKYVVQAAYPAYLPSTPHNNTQIPAQRENYEMILKNGIFT